MSCPRLAGGGSGGDVAGPVQCWVIGADHGANGYTTRAQADQLRPPARAAPGGAVAPAGQRHGWAGPYLAKTSGCPAALTDPPVAGRRSAAARARVEDLTGRRGVVVVVGAHPPFRAEALRLLPSEGGHSTVKGGLDHTADRAAQAAWITSPPHHATAKATRARPLAILKIVQWMTFALAPPGSVPRPTPTQPSATASGI
jgi:hypothetical protein